MHVTNFEVKQRDNSLKLKGIWTNRDLTEFKVETSSLIPFSNATNFINSKNDTITNVMFIVSNELQCSLYSVVFI